MAGKSNGSIIQGQERAQILHFLAEGFTPYFIAKKFRRAIVTIVGLRDEESIEINRRKPMLAALHERNAMLALHEMGKRLESNPSKFTNSELNFVAGTSSDKAVTLRGDAALTIKHEHTHSHQVELVNALQQVAKTIQARVIQPEPKQLENQ